MAVESYLLAIHFSPVGTARHTQLLHSAVSLVGNKKKPVPILNDGDWFFNILASLFFLCIILNVAHFCRDA